MTTNPDHLVQELHRMIRLEMDARQGDPHPDQLDLQGLASDLRYVAAVEGHPDPDRNLRDCWAAVDKSLDTEQDRRLWRALRAYRNEYPEGERITASPEVVTRRAMAAARQARRDARIAPAPDAFWDAWRTAPPAAAGFDPRLV